LIAALLFGLHPIHLETVAWISGVTDSLMALLLIPAFITYMHFREGGVARWIAACLVLYALALLSKDTAIVLPAFVIAYECLYGDAPRRWSDRIHRLTLPVICFVAVTLLYLVARSNALHGVAHKTVN